MASDQVRSTGPRLGLTAEEWVKHWETDFSEFSKHDHKDDHHGQHDTPGDHEHADHHHEHADHDHEHGAGGHDHVHGEGCGGQQYLKKHLSKFTRGQATISALVSLCGDSSDVSFLAGLGHNVTGIEVSEKAVKSIFENSSPPIPYSVANIGTFKVYTATNDMKLSIYVGNFFATLPDDVGPFDAAWDGHGIISLPDKDMKPYADKLNQLLKPGGVILFSTVHYDVNELTKGPAPAPISSNELGEFFPGYKIELLENDDFVNEEFEGVKKCTNPINLVTKPC